MNQEARLFARMSAFGLITGTVYWFLTYETAGTVLLLGFGLATLIAAIAVFVLYRIADRRRARREAAERREGAERPGARAPEPAGGAPATASAGLDDAPEVEPVARPGWTPIGIAIGLGGLALGGAFGPWFTLGGLAVTGVSAVAWLAVAMAETDDARDAERLLAGSGPATRAADPELLSRGESDQ